MCLFLLSTKRNITDVWPSPIYRISFNFLLTLAVQCFDQCVLLLAVSPR